MSRRNIREEQPSSSTHRRVFRYTNCTKIFNRILLEKREDGVFVVTGVEVNPEVEVFRPGNCDAFALEDGSRYSPAWGLSPIVPMLVWWGEATATNKYRLTLHWDACDCPGAPRNTARFLFGAIREDGSYPEIAELFAVDGLPTLEEAMAETRAAQQQQQAEILAAEELREAIMEARKNPFVKIYTKIENKNWAEMSMNDMRVIIPWMRTEKIFTSYDILLASIVTAVMVIMAMFVIGMRF